jgi:hypothetical protein
MDRVRASCTAIDEGSTNDSVQLKRWVVCSALIAGLGSACTLHHSKVPIPDPVPVAIPPDAKFVTSDDSGLAILGVLLVSEPDHYAVLLERIRRRYNCAKLHHAQLDFYSDIWLFVSFPIARVTAICEQQTATISPPPTQPPAPPPTPPDITPPEQPIPPPLGPPQNPGS